MNNNSDVSRFNITEEMHDTQIVSEQDDCRFKHLIIVKKIYIKKNRRLNIYLPAAVFITCKSELFYVKETFCKC